MQSRVGEGDTPHLLVVDDDPDMGAFIADAAEMVGYRCTLATDTAQFTRAMGSDIALILLDLVMPETDGVELLRMLGQQGYAGRIVLMSGCDKRVLETASELAKALGLQVLGHFQKPIRLRELETLLRQHMACQSARGGSTRASQPVSAHELQRAITEDQFLLHYQPQLDIASGAVVGVEALVRWHHPERGLIYPDAFIGLAESLGLIDALGWLVMQRGLREFDALTIQGEPLTLSFNVSAYSLSDLALPDKLLALTRTYGVSPARIVLEITESGLARELAKALDILTRLRMKQFQLSIDDFGTGYAMMQQLRRVPATELKIDRAFVQDALTDDRARVVVHKTIEIGHELGMRVVAEGVETPQHLDVLKTHTCDVAQGYLFSRPLAVPDLLVWLEQHRARLAEPRVPQERESGSDRTPRVSARARRTSSSGTQARTVLIVEDFLLMRQIIKGFLRRMGYTQILEAEHGVEALTRLRQQPVDLVLADWDLPQMDGFALLTAMRDEVQWCTIPFLMITGEATRDKVMAAIQAGANGYILKPFTRGIFEAKVTELMARLPDLSV